jgi:hypothetical protein
MTPYRIFLAHPKALMDADIDALCAEALDRVSSALPDRRVAVIAGRDAYRASYQRCGTWEAWARYIATGTEYGTGEPAFHAVVVAPVPALGKATAGIVQHALTANKPVFVLNDGTLRRVLRIDVPPHGGDFFHAADCVLA